MKKNLVVLTMNFPYGLGESFIENEIPHYNHFDKVLFIPMQPVGTIRNLNFPENISIHKVNSISKTSKIIHLLLILFKHSFWEEITEIFSHRGFIKSKIKKLITFQIHSEWYKFQVLKILNQLNINPRQNIIYYSYWMMQPAYVAAVLNDKKIASVTRCHRWDLYEYLTSEDYLPFRKMLFNRLNKILPISNDGKVYLENRYAIPQTKVNVSRLGTLDNNTQPYQRDREYFKLVSCSWVTPVKRIEKIIEALSTINYKVEWTHIGDGPIFHDIESKARKLPENITVNLLGSLTNKEIIEYYKINYHDLFINVSESEGIPVSIMEAISFGIPAIATNVGATNEIVIEGITGFLIDENCSEESIANKIKLIKELSDDEYIKLRQTTRKYWKEKYFAETNYSNFIKFLAYGL